MRLSSVFFTVGVGVCFIGDSGVIVDAQDGGLELPVQLIGFPVIILAVKLSNFVKKLTYALNPRTYQSRTKRKSDAIQSEYDVEEIERRLIDELGSDVCIYERVCTRNAIEGHQRHHHIGWNDLVRKYNHAPDGKKQFYMLSVFLGDILGSPKLCSQLVERGRSCGILT